MRSAVILALLATVASAAQLEPVATFGWGNQPTGVAVSSSGRVFVNFPRWFANHSAPSVAEVVGSKLVPYPDPKWNAWKAGDSPEGAFVCVQSVFVDHFDRLWILDPAAAFLGNVTKGGARLFQVDMATNSVVKTFVFDDQIAPDHSYLNDVRISADGNYAFLTDSNLGGLKVLNLKTSEVRSVLDNHPSTHAEPGVVTAVEGQLMYLAGTNPPKPATFQSDGIAVIGKELYFHAVTAKTLYSIGVDVLTNASNTEHDFEMAVKTVAASGIHDGMVAAADKTLSKNGVLLMTAIEKDGIDYLSKDGQNRVLPLVSDERLQWPDSLSVPVLTPGKKNFVYVTASQVNFAPFIQDAKPRRNVYALYRVLLPQDIFGSTDGA